MKLSAFAFVLSSLALALPVSVLADHHEKPPSLADTWIMVPTKGMESEFEEGLKKHVAFRLKEKDSRTWNIYTPTIGENMAMYGIRACCFEWSDMDTYVTESNDKGFNDHFNKTVGPYVDHTHHYVDNMDLENSHWPEGAGPYRYFGVTTWTYKEDAGPSSNEARKKFSQMALKEGWADDHNWLWTSRIGGKDTLMLTTPFENYADMKPPEKSFREFLVEKMGSEVDAMETFDAFSSGFESSDYTVWVHRKNLSMPTK